MDDAVAVARTASLAGVAAIRDCERDGDNVILRTRPDRGESDIVGIATHHDRVANDNRNEYDRDPTQRSPRDAFTNEVKRHVMTSEKRPQFDDRLEPG